MTDKTKIIIRKVAAFIIALFPSIIIWLFKIPKEQASILYLILLTYYFVDDNIKY